MYIAYTKLCQARSGDNQVKLMVKHATSGTPPTVMIKQDGSVPTDFNLSERSLP